MLHALLFVFYGLLLTYAVMKLPFLRNSRLRPSVLVTLFWLRVAVACLHNWVAFHYYPGRGDIWAFFEDSIRMKGELIQSPAGFFSRYIAGSYGFNFLVSGSAWDQMQYKVVYFLNIIFDFFSFNNFYVNTLIFSFFVFIGNIALFRVFMKIFRDHLPTALLCLLIPSTLFWTACIYKDGIIYCLTGFLLLYLHSLMTDGIRIKKIIGSLLLLSGIFLLRSDWMFALVPAILLWYLVEKKIMRSRIAITALFGGGILLLYAVDAVTHHSLLQVITEKQHEFQQLEGGSKVFLPLLQADWYHFMTVLPYAILNGFFQPLPGSGGQVIYLAFSVELIILWLIICRGLFRRPGNLNPPDKGFNLFCLFLSLSGLLLIGYTVPFVGAIVRYRGIFWPFLLAPFVYRLPFHHVHQWLQRRLVIHY